LQQESDLVRRAGYPVPGIGVEAVRECSQPVLKAGTAALSPAAVDGEGCQAGEAPEQLELFLADSCFRIP